MQISATKLLGWWMKLFIGVVWVESLATKVFNLWGFDLFTLFGGGIVVCDDAN